MRTGRMADETFAATCRVRPITRGDSLLGGCGAVLVCPGRAIENSFLQEIEMNSRNVLLLGALGVLFGCATYAPPKIDPKTGLYETGTSLSENAIHTRNTSVNLSKYRFVYLVADTNVYPRRFEFFTRAALARSGFNRVLNSSELTELIASSPRYSAIQSISDPVSLRRLAEQLGPLLQVQFSSRWDGDVSRYVTMTVTDLATGEQLLHVYHPKLIWMDVDGEAHYPVLNEFKKWADACQPGKDGRQI